MTNEHANIIWRNEQSITDVMIEMRTFVAVQLRFV